jgi:hypothetical protein
MVFREAFEKAISLPDKGLLLKISNLLVSFRQ